MNSMVIFHRFFVCLPEGTSISPKYAKTSGIHSKHPTVQGHTLGRVAAVAAGIARLHQLHTAHHHRQPIEPESWERVVGELGKESWEIVPLSLYIYIYIYIYLYIYT